jgi:hypothetical protein
MASCRAVNTLASQQARVPTAPGTGRAPAGPGEDRAVELRRWLATLRVNQRILGQCFGARSCAWLSRAAALGFAITAIYATRPLPGTLDSIVRLSLVSLSWCAGLAALSGAGLAPSRAIDAGRGLFLARGVSPERIQARQHVAVAVWIWRHVGLMALVVMAVCAGLTPEPHRAARLASLALGGCVYLLVLGVTLGILSHLCHAAGRSRGQLLLVGLVLVPEILAPAWPTLPTVSSNYGHLLDACLRPSLIE